MYLPLLLKWIIIWFSVAAPIGPVGVLCIRRSLKRGRLSGFVSGLWTATMDAVYSVVAIFWIALVWDFLLLYKDFLQAFAVLFLVFLGHRILFEHRYSSGPKLWRKGLLSDFLSTVIITWSNPMTIFGLAAIFTSIDITHEIVKPISAIMLVLGVFLGSTLWRFILSSWVQHIGKKMDHSIVAKINKIAGICLIGFGVFLMINLLVWKH